MINFLLGLFSQDLGIDLGTANTLVFVRGKGIVIREPTVIAQHKKTRDILAIGQEAKRMVGRTPASIVAVRPLRDGAISDFETTTAMLSYFITKVHQNPQQKIPKIPRPQVVIGIPSGVTEVERRAVADAALEAGARRAFLIEQPMAAAIGCGLPVAEAVGSAVVDIGGGTTEIAVISLGGIVVGKSLRVAGDRMDGEIVSYVRTRYNILIGERTAEELKMTIGTAHPSIAEREMTVSGRDLETGLPTTLKLKSGQIREAITPVLSQITAAISETIEDTPPELLSDIAKSGITLAGGGAKLSGLAKLIADEIRLPVIEADDPQSAVVLGTGAVLEDLGLLAKVQVESKFSI